jgi:hypothetical protein
VGVDKAPGQLPLATGFGAPILKFLILLKVLAERMSLSKASQAQKAKRLVPRFHFYYVTLYVKLGRAEALEAPVLSITKYVCHSKTVLQIAAEFGWKPGARYTNLRDVRGTDRLGFLDIDWKNYCYDQHLTAAKSTKPEVTVAQDVVLATDLPMILEQAEALAEHADNVIIVPKDINLSDDMIHLIPEKFLLGYSVPTKYGGTAIPLEAFDGRPVHLLGGRPDVQRHLADSLNVTSMDTNRFTLDAGFGDYFDGNCFRPHPKGGYVRCLKASLENTNKLWIDYRVEG